MTMVSSAAPPGPQQWAPALVDLYEARYAALVRLAYLLTGSPAVAEELVQEAFISTHRGWERVREPAAYVRTAVVNGVR
jgi:DNA-directed RNA polymerase specialized sigma24 family protein